MSRLEEIIVDLHAAIVGLDPAVVGPWHVSPAAPGTYGYDSVVIDDGRKVAGMLEKWPEGAAEYVAAASPANVSDVLEEVTRLRARVDGLLAAMNREVGRRRDLARELEKLREAGVALYQAGLWYLPTGGLSEAGQGALWLAFRDALGLAPGTATAAGIGANPTEPPLPFLDRPGREL